MVVRVGPYQRIVGFNWPDANLPRYMVLLLSFRQDDISDHSQVTFGTQGNVDVDVMPDYHGGIEGKYSGVWSFCLHPDHITDGQNAYLSQVFNGDGVELDYFSIDQSLLNVSISLVKQVGDEMSASSFPTSIGPEPGTTWLNGFTGVYHTLPFLNNFFAVAYSIAVATDGSLVNGSLPGSLTPSGIGNFYSNPLITNINAVSDDVYSIGRKAWNQFASFGPPHPIRSAIPAGTAYEQPGYSPSVMCSFTVGINGTYDGHTLQVIGYRKSGADYYAPTYEAETPGNYASHYWTGYVLVKIT